MATVPNDTEASPPGRPPRLSLEAILSAARTILRQEGANRLSMRRLAKDLDSTPMAIYYYVRNKDELLLLLLDAHARGFPRPALPDDPRERLLVVANCLYDILSECSWIVEVLASDDLMASSALWIVEDMVDAGVRCGMSAERAVYAYRVVWYYIAGELLIRFTRSRRRAEAGMPTHREHAFASLDPEKYPHLVSLSSNWPELTGRDDHRKGLEDIVAGLLDRNT